MVLVHTKGNKNITNIYFLNFTLLRYKEITYSIFGVSHVYIFYFYKNTVTCFLVMTMSLENPVDEMDDITIMCNYLLC